MYEVLLILNVAVFGLALLWYVRRPYASMFHPATFYLFFHGLIFVFRPFLVHYRGYDGMYRAFQFEPSQADQITVILAAMLGFVAFLVGSALAGNAPLAFRRTRADEVERTALLKPFLVVTAICGPIALASTWSTWSNAGSGNDTMILDRGTGYAINTTGNGYFMDAQVMLIPLVVLAVWLARYRLIVTVPLLAGFLFVRAGTGGRWTFMVAAACLLLLYLFDRGRRWPSPGVLAPVAALMVLFVMVGQDRGAGIRGIIAADTRKAYYQAPTDDRLLESMDFANLEFFQYIVYVVPQRSGTYGYFLNNLQLLTEPIPRVLWKGKPIGAPIKMYNLMDYGRPIGMTNSLPGEGWAQLGYAGVALWCGLVGALMGRLYGWFFSRPASNVRLLSYVTVMALSLLFFRDGVLITLVRLSLFCFVPLVLLFVVARLLGVPSPAALAAARGRRAPAPRSGQEADGRAVPALPRSQRSRAEPSDQPLEDDWLPRSRRRRSSDGGPVPRAWRGRGGSAPAE